MTPAPRGLSKRVARRESVGSLVLKVLQIPEVKKKNHPSAQVAKLALKFVPGCPISRGERGRDCAEWREDG